MQNSVPSLEGSGSVSIMSVINVNEEPFILVAITDRREAMTVRISAECAAILGRALLGEAKRLGELVKADEMG